MGASGPLQACSVGRSCGGLFFLLELGVLPMVLF